MIVRGDAVMRMEDDAHMYRVHVPEVHRIVRPRSELPLWATVLRHSIDPVRPSEARRRGRPRCARCRSALATRPAGQRGRRRGVREATKEPEGRIKARRAGRIATSRAGIGQED